MVSRKSENLKSYERFTNTLWPLRNSFKEFSCSGRRLSSSNCSFTSLNAFCKLSSVNFDISG